MFNLNRFLLKSQPIVLSDLWEMSDSESGSECSQQYLCTTSATEVIIFSMIFFTKKIIIFFCQKYQHSSLHL